MSHIFYDHLIILEEVEVSLKKARLEPEEREELERLIDETVHHRVVGRILEVLPREHHEEFLEKFHAAPYDISLLAYLKEHAAADIEEIITREGDMLRREFLKLIRES